ncbi:hypothetical protein OIU78_019239 [Salix suchowensis]|nr:hypothetical protein OIU78_019239 [Salix suchowensis]
MSNCLESKLHFIEAESGLLHTLSVKGSAKCNPWYDYL